MLIGITAATAIVHLAPVGIGYWISEAFADQRLWISMVTGVAFFLAELGDKTILATITLATQEGWLGTWIGSTLSTVVADALAIAVGVVLDKNLPEHIIEWGAAALFAIFGLLLIIDGAGVFA